jgi:nucleoside-diphosphate-sugar epimerase
MSDSLSLVTGAAGFLGQALVKSLLSNGESVRAVILPNDPRKAELQSRAATSGDLQLIEADVTDANALDGAFAGVKHVFHTAALIHAWAPWERFRAVNVGGTRNVAESALRHGVERLVHISTTDVFGIPHPGQVFDETSPFQPWGEPYADTKIDAERWLWDCRKTKDLPLTVVYPGWVYGPGDRAFFPSLAQAISDGFMIFWQRDVRLPWVYVHNLADACLLAATHPAALGNGYIVHDDSGGPSLQEVCARIAGVLGKPPPTRHVPYAAAYAAAWTAQHIWRLGRFRGPPPLLTVDVKAFGHRWNLSTQKVRRELRWAPATPVDEAMDAALESLREALHPIDP